MIKESRDDIMKKTISFMLLLCAALSAAACGQSGTEPGNGTAPVLPDTAGAAVTDRAEVQDTVPALDFGGKTFRFLYRKVSNLPDYEIYADQTGDIINDAVFNRNLRVADRLNVAFEFSGQGSTAADEFPTAVFASVQAGEDAYSAWVWGQTRTLACASTGYLADMSEAKYLDFDQPWWNNRYMEEVRTSPDNLYFLSGDLLITVISRMSTLFLNKALYADLYGDIGLLCDKILDGNFTYDTFLKLVEGAYADVNGNGAVDVDDVFGIRTTKVSNADHFAYTAGLVLGKRGSDGKPAFNVMTESNTRVLDAVNNLYYNTQGVYLDDDTEISNGMAETRFASGQMLFLPMWFSATKRLRTMDSDYMMLPYPKLDETQESYRALIQNTASVLTVPITNPDLDMAGAVIEALTAESYRTVVPVYYETGLKTKYSRDDISSQMVDLIYSAATTDFFYAHSLNISSVGTIAREVVGAQKDFASYWASKETAAQAALAKLLDEADR